LDKNIGVSLGLDDTLVKVFPLPNMKVKLFFRSLSDLWSSVYTDEMIWTLKVLNYYQIIRGIDFALSIFTGAKLMDLEEIPIKTEVEKFMLSLKIPDIFEELEASFLQRYDENYAVSDTFHQYEIFE